MTSKSLDSIGSNIWKLSVLRGLAFAWFPIPTIILFYQSHGVGLEQAVLLKTILSLSILLLEVPSGYIADRLGRKFCLIVGSSVWLCGWLFYCTGNSFSWFAIAEILAGIAVSLISGADTAIAYETLLQLNKADAYRSFEGRLIAIAGITEAVCGLIGAAIAEINLVYPFYLQTVCLALYLAISCTLIEPRCQVEQADRQHFLSSKAIIFDVFTQHPNLLWLILLSSIFSTATFLIVWLSQGYFQLIDLPIAAMGWTWAIFHLLMSLASVNARRLENRLGTKKALLVLIVLLSVAYLFLGSINSLGGIFFIALIYLVRGARSPLTLNLINQSVPSSIRATVLSLSSFSFHLGFAVFAPIIGAVSSRYSLSLGLFVSGCCFLIAGCWCWYQYQVKS
ncbi:MAG: MFS transporter [Cyanobacteria bacterium P01_G01_bin.19]